MAFVLVWSKSGETDKHFEVFGERRGAEAAALDRRREGSDAYVVSGELNPVDGTLPDVTGTTSGGFKA